MTHENNETVSVITNKTLVRQQNNSIKRIFYKLNKKGYGK
mgnify:CR=1 FL=1